MGKNSSPTLASQIQDDSNFDIPYTGCNTYITQTSILEQLLRRKTVSSIHGIKLPFIGVCILC